jgi:hypothetical protein
MRSGRSFTVLLPSSVNVDNKMYVGMLMIPRR